MKVDKKILTLREEKGLSQLDLARELDVSRQAISRWENGMAKPTMENLIALGKLFGVSAADLLNEDSGLPSQEAADPQTVQPEPHCPAEGQEGSRPRRPRRIVLFAILAACALILGIYVFSRAARIGDAGEANSDVLHLDELESVDVLDFGEVEWGDLETLP